jgi:DnaJ-class molecular chaperone
VGAGQARLAMNGAEVVVIVAAIAVAGWWIDVHRHPMRSCPSCKGSKKNTSSNGQRWRTCRRCAGKGAVRRFGAGKP